MSGDHIENVSNFEYYGLYLDRKTNFIEHIQVFKKSLSFLRIF